jgi:hypothetical protein
MQKLRFFLVISTLSALFPAHLIADELLFWAEAARSHLNEDGLMKQTSANFEGENYDTSYAIGAEYKLYEGLTVGVSAGSHGEFKQSSNAAQVENWRFKDKFLAIHTSLNVWHDDLNSLSTELGLGAAFVEQRYQTSIDNLKSDDTVFQQSIGLFATRKILFGQPDIYAGLGWRYTHYELENTQRDFNIGFNTFFLRLVTVF